MHRASVQLDSDMLDELVREAGTSTKAEAVRDAVVERLRVLRMRRIQAAAGTVRFSKGAEELRHEDSRIG